MFAKDATAKLNQEKILKAQIYIQNNLGNDLSLVTLAQQVGLSNSYFHQLFKDHLGETLKSYTDRLRVEKSRYDINISRLSLLEIAQRYGFKNPETYSRTFKRHFGQLPSAVAREVRSAETEGALSARVQNQSALIKHKHTGFMVTELAALGVAFCRHIGPYDQVPLVAASGENPWRELLDFVIDEKLFAQHPSYIGIPQDSPDSTSLHKLRYDMCIQVNRAFKPFDHIAHQTITSGFYGVLCHAGPYSTLNETYQLLFKQASQLSKFTIASRPVFELLIDIAANNPDDHTWTELYIPLDKK